DGQHPDLQLQLFKYADGALGGFLARLVRVVGDDYLLLEAGDEPCLLRRKRGTEGGDGTVEARLMQGYDVDVALDEDNVPGFGLFSQIQAEKVMAFAEHRRLGAVEVLGLHVPERAAGESDDVAAHVDDGEHQPAAEGVVHSALLAAAHETGVIELALGVAFLLHGRAERVPALRRAAEAEAPRRPGRDSAPEHVVHRRRARRGRELLVKKARRVPVEGIEPVPLGLARVALLLRDLHPGAPGQELHGLGEAEILYLHYEVYDAPALAAAEAVVDLLRGRHREGRRLLTVEGTEPEEVLA